MDGVDVETTKRQLGDDQGPSHSARGDPQENNGNSPGLATSCSSKVDKRQLKQQKTEERSKFYSSNKKAQQLKELEASFVAATKEMQSAQAKMAVETAKEVSPPLYVDLRVIVLKALILGVLALPRRFLPINT